jgi:transposase InsO family protein
LSTLLYALATGAKADLFHADQGNACMAPRCPQDLEQHGIRGSVRDGASPWQNGDQESCFGRFKQAFGEIDRFESPGERFEAIHHPIHYDNHPRIHPALKMPPAIFAAHTFSDTGLQQLRGLTVQLLKNYTSNSNGYSDDHEG